MHSLVAQRSQTPEQSPGNADAETVALVAPAGPAWLKALRLWPAVFGRRLLVVGCGEGLLTGALWQLGVRAEGLDPDRAAIARARSRWPCTRFHVGAPEEFRSADNFDFVHCQQALRSLDEAQSLLDLCVRVLRARGVVSVSCRDVNPGQAVTASDADALDAVVLAGLFRRQSFEALRREPVGTTGLRQRFRRQRHPASGTQAGPVHFSKGL